MIVYTAIINDIDYLKNIEFDGQYEAFINPFYRNEKWKTIEAKLLFDNPRRNARMYKILSHQFINDEWSLWMDGNISLNVSPEEIIKKYGKNDIVMFNAHDWHTLKEEVDNIVTLGKDIPENVYPQYKKYIKDGYIDDHLTCTGCILRHHTSKVIEFNNFWWSELCAGSVRDQISVDYAIWKTGIKVSHFDGCIWNSPDFIYSPHIK